MKHKTVPLKFLFGTYLAHSENKLVPLLANLIKKWWKITVSGMLYSKRKIPVKSVPTFESTECMSQTSSGNVV